MSSNSDQCALAEDGSLLDASKIVFFNDPDDDKPLPCSVPGSPSIHAFFHAGKVASFVAGSRRSGRVTRPSARVMDPDNVEVSVSRKRSATLTTSTEASVRAARRAKLACSVDENATGSEDEENDVEVNTTSEAEMYDATSDEELEGDGECEAEEAYLGTKTMGDADRQVTF